jgi:hypothetical protein
MGICKMEMPRTQRLSELLGAYSVKATAEVSINTQLLYTKVRHSHDFTDPERATILRALDFCSRKNIATERPSG